MVPGMGHPGLTLCRDASISGRLGVRNGAAADGLAT